MFLQIFGFFERICYYKMVFSLFGMKLLSYILIFAYIFLSVLFIVHAGDNITKSDFTINLKDIDPVWSGNSIVGWTSALTSLLSKIASLLLFAIPIVAAVSLIIAGYYYILSSGDSEKATQAKTIIKWNLVAIVVALFSYSIIILLSKMLDGTLL
jgi:Type IV secretion system pilin